MNELERLIENIAVDLVMVDSEDLPALAGLHESFLQLSKTIADDSNVIATVAKNCAGLIEMIVLREVESADAALDILNDAVIGLQAIIRDKRDPSQVDFPEDIYQSSSEKAPSKKSKNSPKAKAAKPAKKTKAKRGVEPAAAPPPDENKDKKESFIINIKGGDTELLGDFITEGREHCLSAEDSLMELETDPDNHDAIDTIFRGFHTIKGAAGFLVLGPVSLLAHESETLLDMARKGEIVIRGKIADAIFGSIDALRSLFTGLEEALGSGESFDGTEVVSSLLDNLRQLIADKGVEGEIDNLDAEAGNRVGDILVDMGATTQPDIDEALTRKETADEKIGQTLVKQGKVPAKAVVHALRQQKKSQEVRITTIKEIVKIDTERLDRLVDTIGELVIAESMVGQDEQILSIATPKTTKNMSHLNKITRELQEMGMAMRLVPVKGAFQKLSRAVRDLSKRSGKKVNLELSGEESEVDRGIVESIGDPLMHMVRNSLDHGLETPEERIKAGKPETGNVWVRAFHKGGNIYFEIEDDGRGLDRKKILAKARERGLISGNKEMSDREIYKMVLLPGFSTAQKVTDISGRGVGMDVVKKNVDSMRGHLEIDSRAGQGTKFSMQLPLTLAIIDGMMVGVGDERFVIPTLSVVESLQLTPEMINTVAGKGEMISLRGELLPIFKIRNLFLQQRSDKVTADSTVVVVDDLSRRVGLIVDELFGQHQIVIKSLGPVFKEQKWISGGAILSDGTIGLIIDVSGIIKLVDSIDAYCELPADELIDKDIFEIEMNNDNEEQSGETVEETAGETIEETAEALVLT